MQQHEQGQGFVRWHCWASGEIVERPPGSPDLADHWVYAHGGDAIERRIVDDLDRRWAIYRRSLEHPPTTVLAGEAATLPPPPAALVPPPARPHRPWRIRRRTTRLAP